MIRFAFAGLVAVFLGWAPAAMAGEPDIVVKAQLDAKGVKYEVDKDGDFKVIYQVGDAGRTQLAFIRSFTAEYAGIKVREIWSPAFSWESELFPVEVANRLLEASNQAILGSWVKNGKVAMFVVKIPADMSAQEMVSAVTAATSTADEMEKLLTGKDDF